MTLPLLLASGAIVAVLALARATVRVVTVRGPSMEPTLPSGSRVLALRRWPRRWLRRGHVVLLAGMRDAAAGAIVVKRVARVGGQTVDVPADRRDYERLDTFVPAPYRVRLAPGEIYVLGDNAAGIDSRHWGPVAASAVVGLVLPRLAVRPAAGAEP